MRSQNFNLKLATIAKKIAK